MHGLFVRLVKLTNGTRSRTSEEQWTSRKSETLEQEGAQASSRHAHITRFVAQYAPQWNPRRSSFHTAQSCSSAPVRAVSHEHGQVDMTALRPPRNEPSRTCENPTQQAFSKAGSSTRGNLSTEPAPWANVLGGVADQSPGQPDSGDVARRGLTG